MADIRSQFIDRYYEEYDDTEDATKKVVAKEYYSAEDAMDFFLNGNISYSLDTDFEDGTIDEESIPSFLKSLSSIFISIWMKLIISILF